MKRSSFGCIMYSKVHKELLFFVCFDLSGAFTHRESSLAFPSLAASKMEAILSQNPTTSMAMSLSSAFLGSRMRSKSSLQLAYKDGAKLVQVMAAETNKKVVPFSSYAVPIDDLAGSSFMTRPLAEILRDMNKRVPDKVIKTRCDQGALLKYIPWYHANRMLSFYAPGWSGEVRSITYSADGKTVTVVYRVTLRGSDGEAYRESTGTSFLDGVQYGDPVQKAEGMAFRRACARFGLGLYLYHEDEPQ